MALSMAVIMLIVKIYRFTTRNLMQIMTKFRRELLMGIAIEMVLVAIEALSGHVWGPVSPQT
ncbi:hypothetical protein GCM10027562_28120 [Arthrobacter pigmenti]